MTFDGGRFMNSPAGQPNGHSSSRCHGDWKRQVWVRTGNTHSGHEARTGRTTELRADPSDGYRCFHHRPVQEVSSPAARESQPPRGKRAFVDEDHFVEHRARSQRRSPVALGWIRADHQPLNEELSTVWAGICARSSLCSKLQCPISRSRDELDRK